jgi:hypothetical protein
MQTNRMFLKKLDLKSYKMLGKDIIAVSLHMGKLVLENHIQWLAMAPIR